MAKKGPPLSPKDDGKGEEGASGETPMRRFKRLAGAVAQVPVGKVKAQERKQRQNNDAD